MRPWDISIRNPVFISMIMLALIGYVVHVALRAINLLGGYGYVSPGIVALEGERIGEPAGSDHFPVMLKVAVPLPQ